MSVVVRVAPSPTGLLHVGNIRTALVNWLFARSHGGLFWLRMDDTDEDRSTPEFAEAIERDLRWLGLGWDRFARQSDRYGRYREVEEGLRASGRLYPCYETAEELALRRKSLLGRGLQPIYDRAALKLTAADRARLEAQGRRPHWRFRLEHKPVAWDDLVRGPVQFAGEHLSDPVLVREDGRPLYTLSSVIDDADFGITHIIRGEDHVTNTAVQIQLFEAIGSAVPRFAHLPLLTGAKGEELSKRIGGFSIASLRDEHGVEAMAILSLLAKLGTSDPIEARHALPELVAEFDLGKLARGTPKFDMDELSRLNARILHGTPFADVAARLAALGLDRVDEPFWLAVRPNIARLADVAEWWRVAQGPVEPVIADADLAAVAARALPPGPWGEETWSRWVAEVRAATGKTGKALFMPLRLALTGREHGPELKNLLPLIGYERAEARLAGKVA